MNATTVGVDLAKNLFEVALADGEGRIGERKRLSRGQFLRFFANRSRCRIVMEACGSAHHWARTLAACGHEPRLLPAQYVRAYVKRNKTDRADAAALIEAARSGEIRPVPVKSIEQQLIQQLHRLRSQWMRTRTARINGLRGLLREFGIVIARGAERGLAEIRTALALADNGLPELLRPLIAELLGEIEALEQRSTSIEQQLSELTRADPVVQALMRIPGIGLLSATAYARRSSTSSAFLRDGTSAAGLGSPRASTPPGSAADWGASASAAMSTCARCWCTARAPYSTPASPPTSVGDPSIGCALGSSPPSAAAATTKPPSLSPTSSRASSGRPGRISGRSTAIGPHGRVPPETPCIPPLFGCT
jgi:transposase